MNARRSVAALAVVSLVLLLHAAGLSAWTSTALRPAPTAAAPVPTSLQVRALPAPPMATPVVVPEPASVVAAAPVDAPAAVRVVARPARAVPTAAAERPRTDRAAVADDATAAAAPAAAVAEPGTELAAASAAAPSAEPVAEVVVAEAKTTLVAAAAPPVYPTRLPPSFRSTFRMQRGILSGTGTLDWQLDGEHYRLALVGSVAGVDLLSWTSQGGIDHAGVAPERFVTQTRGRNAQATNFQRGAGKITYSASTAEHPLPAGVQDRVSWLVQLAAVVAAEPARWSAPGTMIRFAVAGTRGDVGLWQFVVLGWQTIETPVGRIETLALRREAKRPFDTRGEVWLDPQRHHMPVRVTLSTIDGRGEVSDMLSLLLQSSVP